MMPKQVCGGAMLKCSMGLAPGTLMVLPANAVMTGMPAATVMDNIPMLNILPFGMCKSMSNPMVAAATAAAATAALEIDDGAQDAVQGAAHGAAGSPLSQSADS